MALILLCKFIYVCERLFLVKPTRHITIIIVIKTKRLTTMENEST